MAASPTANCGSTETEHFLCGAPEPDDPKGFGLFIATDDLPCPTAATIGRTSGVAPLPLPLHKTALGIEVRSRNQNSSHAGRLDQAPAYIPGYLQGIARFFVVQGFHGRIRLPR